jgi:ABC-type sugar transport system substrate-binding protein
LSKAPEGGSNSFAGTTPGPPQAVSAAIAGRKDGLRRSAGTAKIVELILARPTNADRMYLVQALRREMGKAKILFRTVEPQATETGKQPAQPLTPAELAEAIRTAVANGAAGLIVEPLEEPAVLDALYEADARGVAVLLLDRSLPARGGKPLHSVGYMPFTEPGRQIVQAALDAAGLLGQLEGHRIILLHDRSTDAYDAERLAALADPLKAAGKSFDVLEFDGSPAQAAAALRTALDIDPKVAIVLADESNGMIAAYQVLSDRKKTNAPEFLFAGFAAYDYRSSTDLLGRAIAFSDRSVESYATKTFQTISRLLDGKPLDERVEVPMPVHKKSTILVPKTRE